MLNSLATTSKASVPNGSTTKPTRLDWGTMDLSTFLRDGREREMVRVMIVSILESGGRSSKLSGGRKRWSIPEGRELRRACWGWDGGPSEAMMKVKVKRWWERRRLANSISGIKWPIPGLGKMAKWGIGGWASMVDDWRCSKGQVERRESEIENENYEMNEERRELYRKQRKRKRQREMEWEKVQRRNDDGMEV